MSNEKPDLLRFAGEYADQDVDLYELLAVDALTSKEDIHRAWRKRSLKYHPDKAGENFDASKWELFERARDILCDVNARAIYDQLLKARIVRKQEREAMDKENKKIADDLEARENAYRQQKQQEVQRNREAVEKERARLAEEQRMHQEEEQRQAAAEQELEDLAEAQRRLKEKKEEKARRRQVKMSMKATGAVGRSTGPSNRAVLVPGDYIADPGTVKQQYWELVCDKLRAVQALRNLQNVHRRNDQELKIAKDGVDQAEQRIDEAKMQFQQGKATI